MHATLTELFEHLRLGLLWVGTDGVVRYANRGAMRSTGLLAGRRIGDRELARAVVATSVGRVERQLRLPLATSVSGASLAELECRVVPGVEGDDAFVLVSGTESPDHGEGVDVLMQSIDQDLRRPLRAALATLELVRRDTAELAGSVELDLLFDRLDELLQVAERLSDLGSLWNGGAQSADDRIELWPLLQQVWGEVEPLALQRHVRVRFTADPTTREMATLYGSERWIRRLFVECLQGAVRHAPSGSTLDIEHVQLGARACIVLHDCRLFGDDLRGGDAIAHRLCRHVVAQHGGRLREQLDGTARDLVIELPTGAPRCGDDPEMAIAQAQRYAHDLAALMSRGRRAPRAEPADAR
ncbi:MAG: sensor histidine kinase [Rubrivivax sp.]